MQSLERVTLNDVATVTGGQAFKSEQYTSDGRFVLRTINITDNYSITHEGATFISEDDARNYERFALQPFDTLFVMVAATLGKIGLVRESNLPALLNQNMWVIRARPGKVNKFYLHYLFREISKIPLSWVGGSARSFLRRDDVRNLEIALPNTIEQDKIASVLIALDDKIELNRRMNETLEAQARTLFRDWFVDFGPVEAKMAGAAPYLAPDLWSLFPEHLDDDGVPEGWTSAPLSEHFEIIGGGTPKTSVPEYWHGPIPWFSVVDTPAASDVFVFNTEKSVTISGVKNSAARLVRPGTTIISARGTVGNLAMAAQEMTFNQSCYALQERDGASDPFVYLAAKHMVDRLQAMAHGSVFSTITRNTFEGLSLPRPTRSVHQAFDAQASALFEKIRSNVAENRTLAHTRDLLLPKLMSGEIRVGDAAAVDELA